MTSSREREDFDTVLERVLAELPDEVANLLEEAVLIVEDEPSPEILAELGVVARKGEADLCGLHTGVPLDERSDFMAPTTPPTQVCLFRGPILRLAGWESGDLERQIRITLLHELGHLHGLDEDELTALGYD
jgi:predicted Zn-dependent protease with MMP-like domain